MTGLRNFSFDFDTASTTAAAVPTKTPVAPINVEELLDPANPLPQRCLKYVVDASAFVIAASRGDKAATFRDERSKARELGPSSEEFVAVANQIDDLVLEWKRTQHSTMTEAELRWVRARVIDDQLGAGPFEPLRRDPRVTEILLQSPQPTSRKVGTVVEIHGQGLLPAPGVLFGSDKNVLELIERLHPSGLTPTPTRPVLDASLADGSRLHATHACATDGYTFLALRRHPETAHTLVDLIRFNTLNYPLACALTGMVRSRLSIVVAGGTSSGKSSTLNALVPFLPDHLHLSIIEDTLELKAPANLMLVSRRQARPGSDDIADVTIREHIRAALRSRPDVILVGEVRGPEAVDALTAMNTGHEGSMLTCHANSPHETVIRLETMMSESGEVSESAATYKIASAVDIIIHQTRDADGTRRISGVYEVIKPPADSTRRIDHVELRPLWKWDAESAQHVHLADPSPELLELRHAQNYHPLSLGEIERVALAGAGADIDAVTQPSERNS